MIKKNLLIATACYLLTINTQALGTGIFGDVLSARDSSVINIMPTGNSLTQASDPGYRGYLYHLLDSAQYQFDFVGSKNDGKPTNGGDPDHSGFGGYVIGPNPSKGDAWDPWKHGDLLFHLDNGYKIMNNDADVILLEIGINDFFNDLDDYDPNAVGADRLDSLISRIYALNPNVVLLVSNLTPVRWDSNFGNLFNAEVPAIISKYKKVGKNIYPVDLRKGINWNMSSDISNDQLHPTASGYRKMADLFFSSLVPVLDSMLATEQTGLKPTIELTQPKANESFDELGTIHLAAMASDADGQIRKVIFYNGSQKIGEVASSPFMFDWQHVLAGTYTITAVAVDNQRNSATSLPVTIEVKSTGQIVIQENFDDNLAQNWTSGSGNWKLQDGKYAESSGNGIYMSIYDATTFFNYVFSAKVKPNWNNNYGFVFNFKDQANYYLLELDAEPLNATLKLVKNGTETKLATASYRNGGAGLFSTIEIANNGLQTSVKVNGELIFDHVETNQFKSGKLGLYTWWNPVTFDDILIIAAGTTAATAFRREENDLKIFPNPTLNKTVTIEIPSGEKDCRLDVSDNSGKRIFVSESFKKTNYTLHGNILRNRGIYHVRLTSANAVHYGKIIVH